MAQFPLGRRISKDDRDRGYLMTRLLRKEILPTRKTWKIGAANLDQGDTAACVGNAWANFLRSAPIQTTATEQTAWQIYDRAIKLDEWTDNDNDTDRQMGTSVRAGAEAVMGVGRLKSYVWAFSLQPVVEWVLTQGPVVLGTNWYTSMFYPSKEGLIDITPRSRVEGGHAYLLRGVDTRKAMATFCNSWGDSWGKSGNFFMSFKTLERLILEDGGEACSAVEKRLETK